MMKTVNKRLWNQSLLRKILKYKIQSPSNYSSG
jgi:hypothetical protein